MAQKNWNKCPVCGVETALDICPGCSHPLTEVSDFLDDDETPEVMDPRNPYRGDLFDFMTEDDVNDL